MSTATSVERVGDSWIFVWAEDDYAIGFERVKEKSDGVVAEIVVTLAKPGASGRRALVARRTINMLSTVTRNQFAKHLADRTDLGYDDWGTWLEESCNRVVEELRAGAPVIDIMPTRERLQPSYLFDRFLPMNETTLLSADGQSGKGWFAVALAVSLLTNSVVIPGVRPTRHGRTLYLDWETGDEEIKRRRAWIEAGLGRWHPDPLEYREMNRGLHEDIDLLREVIREREITMVIVDSLGPAVADDADAGHTAVRTMTSLRQLPCTRLVLAHVSKVVAQQSGGRGRTLGSVQFENQARCVWEMRHEEGGREVGLFHRKANIGPHQDDIVYRQHWNDQDCTFRMEPVRLLETAELVQYANLRTRCLLALRDGKKEIAVLAEIVHAKPDSLRAQIARWPEFQRIGDGGGRGNKTEWGLKAADGSVPPDGSSRPVTSTPSVMSEQGNVSLTDDWNDVTEEDANVPF